MKLQKKKGNTKVMVNKRNIGDRKFNINWIPYILIGILVIVLYFVWNSKGGSDEENQAIKDAEEKIELLEQQSLVKDSLIGILTIERDSVLTSVRNKVNNDGTIIKTKYVKVKSDIVNLSDDASIELLGKNLGAK